MKNYLLIFAMLTLICGSAISQETITWRFAKPQVIAGTPDLFQFDVEVKASATGTYHRDMQIYFDYNPAAFGADIVANSKVTVSNLTLMDAAKYVVVNSADNTSSKFAVITEATNEMSQNGSGTYFTEVPTTFTGFLRFQIEILNSSELTGIVFDPALMNGGQYKQDIASTDPIKYADPCLYENDLTGASLEGLLFTLKCFAQGPYDAGTGSIMNTDLQAGASLPLSQPYNPGLPYYNNGAPEWLYTGTETVVSFPANTVDWVLVQLRDATDVASAGSAAITGTTAAFLINDGTIVDIDGNPLIVKQAYNDNLYVVIYHRNHLGVISNFSVETDAVGVYEYDFSDAVNKVYGGSSGHIDLGGGIYGLIAADGDADGNVLPSDETSVWGVDVNSSGYLGGDYDLNGLGQASDKTGYWVPNANKSGQLPTAPGGVAVGYTSQIPK